MKNSIVEEIKKLNCGKVLENINLKKYTTYKMDSIAKIMVFPKSVDKLIVLLKYIKKNNFRYKIIGNGSNLIFCNDTYSGIIIKLDMLDFVSITGNTIKVGAGYSLIKLAFLAAKESLSGLEFASGIPGTVGGAIFMNAGAYKSDMGYIVKNVTVLTPDFEIKKMQNKELNFHYRTSFLKENPGYICLEVELQLLKRDKKEITTLMCERKKRRLESQPLNYPSAGSVFRNPKDDYAGRLIEELGFKGKKIGGAMVSEKHANFIINYNNATGKDVKELINLIKKEVKNKYNIDLTVEQEFVE